MSWANKRRRTVQKLVTFTPDEWERVNSLHKKVNKYTTRYRSFTVFARKMLTDGEIRVTEIRPLTDPEPLAREIGRIGVNVNQIAHWANASRWPSSARRSTASSVCSATCSPTNAPPGRTCEHGRGQARQAREIESRRPQRGDGVHHRPRQDRRRKTGQLQLRADRNGLRRAG